MAKILLIEDEKILRENISELLEAYGFICVTAVNGKEGLDKALSEKPDLIICDIMLPFMNGLQIKEELNKHDDFSLIPIIFVSAKGERADLRHGMDLGAADYITKPYKISELLTSVNSRLKQSQNIQSVVHSKVIESINEFIQVSKHECNTPLNGIINLSNILANGMENRPEFAEKALRAINISGKRLYKTLNNLIDLIRLRHYTTPVNQVNTSKYIKCIIEQTISERSAHYNFKGDIKTDINFIHKLHLLQEDLEIIVFEVIDNMFKFSSQGIVSIDLNTENVDGNFMVMTVSNSLPEPILFNENEIGPFRQLNRDQNEQQGSGLGLYLIKVIVENYLGSIKIDTSEPLAFRVILTLPIYGI